MPETLTTNGIQVDVATIHLQDYSAQSNNLFSYRVRIKNVDGPTAKLNSRYWLIIDGEGKEQEVRGPGVVGKYPELSPGEDFEYFSFCNLDTPFGTMEGVYYFSDEDGNEFEVKVPRFYLSTNLNEFEKNTFNRGQVIRHKLYEYTGLIVDYDICFLGDEEWYSKNRTQPPKNEPWYHVIINNTDKVSYVAQRNIEAIAGRKIKHPLVKFFFDGDEDSGYTRNGKSWNDLR